MDVGAAFKVEIRDPNFRKCGNEFRLVIAKDTVPDEVKSDLETIRALLINPLFFRFLSFGRIKGEKGNV